MVNLLRYHASVAALGQLMVDVGLFFAALLLAVFLQRPSTQPLMSMLPSALLFACVMALMNAAFGLYRREPPLEDGAFVRRAILAMLIGFPIAYALYFTDSRGTVLQDATPYAVLFGLSLAIALRKPFLSRTAGALFPRRILVIGTGHGAFEVERTVRALPSAASTVVGFVPLATREEGIAVPRERLTPRASRSPSSSRGYGSTRSWSRRASSAAACCRSPTCSPAAPSECVSATCRGSSSACAARSRSSR